jgi:hypothetical protein
MFKLTIVILYGNGVLSAGYDEALGNSRPP